MARLLATARCAALVAGVLLGAGVGRAASFDFEWDAPAECPRASFVEREVERVVQRPFSELGTAWQKVRASIGVEGGGYRLRVSIVNEGGRASERTLVAASCTEATEAAVAILTAGAAAGSPSAVGSPASGDSNAGPSAANGEANEAASTGTEQPRGAADVPAPRATSHVAQIHPLLGARIGAEIGALASVAPLLQIVAGLELDRFALLGHAGTTSSVVAEIEGGTAGAEMSLFTVGLSACVRATTANPSVSGCAGWEEGRLSARGLGTSEPHTEHTLWMAGLAAAVLDWNIASGGVASFGVTGLIPVRRLRVDAGTIEVHRTPIVGVRPWLGIGWRFQ
jgi:hypothetical protein